MALFDVILKREPDGDLPEQTSDDDLLAWARELQNTKPRRRQLFAAPLE